jgi:hypothetical protein
MWPAILRHYDQHYRPRVEQERAWFASSRSLDEAISRAALATNERGKRFSHQRRISKQSLIEARDALLQNKERINNAKDFDNLFTITTDSLRDMCGVGKLYRYDTTLRIAYYLDVLPTTVYLHAGTRTGARALGLSLNKPFLTINELPAALHDHPAHEVEDILCIYKDEFPLRERNRIG